MSSKTRAPSIQRPAPGQTGPNRGPETMFRSASRDEAGRGDDLDDDDLDDDDLDDDARDDLEDDHEARLSMESAREVADKHDPYRTRPDDMRRGYDHFRRSAAAPERRRRRPGEGDLLELAGSGTRALTRILSLWADLLGPLLPPALRLARSSGRRLDRSREADRYEHHRHEQDRHGQGRYEHDRHDGGRDDERDHRDDNPRHALSDELSVSLEVTSKAPVRVSLELDRSIAPEPLRVRPLRATGSQARPIKGAIVDVDGLDRVVVHIVVPDHTPAGTYEGAVLSADGRARLGRLRVVVRETPDEPAA